MDCDVTAEKAVEIGGSEFGGVADGKTPVGRAHQCQAELDIFAEPGIVAIESEAGRLVQREALFLSENVARKDTHLAAGDARQPGDAHLTRTSAADQIVAGDFALAQHADMISPRTPRDRSSPA